MYNAVENKIKRERKQAFYVLILAVLIMGLLSACGSGGPGDAPGASSPAVVSALGSNPVVLMVSSPQMNSDVTSTVTLTALVRDSNNVAQANQAVTFSANNNGSIIVTRGITDANGTATATLGTGFDPTNRTITVTATAGSASATNTVNVVNTTLDISGLSSISFTTPAVLTITLKDSSGAGIPGRTVAVSSSKGNTLSPGPYVTNLSGQISVTVTPAVAGVDTITASAIGASKTFSLTVNSDVLAISTPVSLQEIAINTVQTVTARYTINGVAPVVPVPVTFATTMGILSSATALTNGSGDATVTISSTQTGPAVISAFVASGPSSLVAVEFVATTASTITLQVNPAVIGTNIVGVSTEKSLVTATVRDVNNNLVKNKTVQFSSPVNASGGTFSPASAITDSSGSASTYFIGGPAPGSVTIRAVEQASGVSATIGLTVAKRALFINVGTGNKIVSRDADTRYQIDYVALVTDSVSNPVVGATVTAKLIPVSFRKGYYAWSTTSNSWVPVPTLVAASSTLPSKPACANEDTLTHNPLYDYNGVLDPGEDVNGNNRLDPGNVASVTATPTDSTGHSVLSIVYAKSYANWVDVRLEAWASLGGSTTNAAVTFTLPISTDDISNQNVSPPGQPSPFGTSQTCFVDLALAPVNAGQIDVSWTTSSQAASYNVYRNGALLTNVTAGNYSDTGLAINTPYCYQIYWVNAFGVQTRLTDSVCSMTLATPVAPVGLTVTPISTTQINLSWVAATNAVSYNVYRNGLLLKSVMTTGTTDSGLLPSTTYSYVVSAVDAAGNESAKSAPVAGTTNGTGPAPTGLAATSVSATQIDLTWNAAAGKAGYNLYRTGGGLPVVLSTPATIAPVVTFSDVSLVTKTQYCYQVTAFDAAGTETALSVPQVCTSTQ